MDLGPVRVLFFQPCLLAYCPPHPSAWCPQLLHEFPCPEHHEGPKEHLLGLAVLGRGFVAKQALFGDSLAQCPFLPQRLEVPLLLSHS